jgi:hypothetical protein
MTRTSPRRGNDSRTVEWSSSILVVDARNLKTESSSRRWHRRLLRSRITAEQGIQKPVGFVVLF